MLHGLQLREVLQVRGDLRVFQHGLFFWQSIYSEKGKKSEDEW